MNEEARELLREDILPVVLGNGIDAHRLAARLLSRYGVMCMLCGERKNLLDWLDLSTCFLRISYKRDLRLAADQLVDFAEENRERFLLLVPMDSAGHTVIGEQAERLETHFVCVEASELEDGWLNTLDIG